MTILVGILAKDGAVIAADRAVTFGLPIKGMHTIKDSHKKIEIIGDRIIVAGTGQVGMGQRFVRCVQKAWDSKKFAGSGNRTDIASELAHDAHQEFGRTGANKGEYGALVAAASPLMLVEFQTQDMQPELKSPDVCYAAMGSGQMLADPYLALMRRIVWPDGQPGIEDAVLAAVWVIHNAIKAAPGFIALPIDVAVLRTWPDSKGTSVARMLKEGEVEQHLENAERVNREFREAFIPPDEAPLTIPPAPAKG